MSSRAMRVVVAVLSAALLAGASVAQAAPGGPFESPPGHWVSGRLAIVHGDDLEAPDHTHEVGSVPDHVLPQLQYWLETDSGEELMLEFAGTPPEATPGAYYDVRGERHGRAFHVAEMNQAAKGGNKGGGGGGKPQPTVPSYQGPRDMIVIPFTFAGDARPLGFTTEQIRERGFLGARSVRTYYEESSASNPPGVTLKGKNDGTEADRDALPGDVTNTYEIVGSTDRCDYSSWATEARTAATNDGWDLSGYEHLVYVFPRLVKIVDGEEQRICRWWGLANIGGSNSWLHGTIDLGIWAHELGHNLTLYHSRTLICSGSETGSFLSVASRCSYEEYGDPFDVMGQAPDARQLHARNKGHLSWFPTTNIASATSGETYTLYPIEMATTGLQVLQIPRGREFLYVDYRRPLGTFDSYGPSDDVVTGVLVHSGPGLASNGNSYLIDTAVYPTTVDTNTGAVEPDFSDAALQPGEGFVDSVSGVYIETLSLNPDGTVTVLVRTGVTNEAPTARPTSAPTLMLVGVPHQAQNAEATDADKNLGRYRWHFESCPSTCPALTDAEGAVAGGTDSITGPTYVPDAPGTYRLALTVWDALGSWGKIILEEKTGL